MPEFERKLLLAQYGDFLASRTLGKDARELVEEAVRSGGRIVVDFSGIDGISLSFADEFAGKLAANLGVDTLRATVRFHNAAEAVAGLLRMAIGNRTREKPPSAA